MRTPSKLVLWTLLSPLLAAFFVLALVGLAVRGAMESFGAGYASPESLKLRDLRRAWKHSGKDYSNN